MAQVNLNIEELDGFVNHIIKNNRFLQDQGKKPVAIEVVGESGIGKTTSIMDMAVKHELDFVKCKVIDWVPLFFGVLRRLLGRNLVFAL